jgi:asparagine N-glycosylation enzyme membrane subunit Stt3
MARRLWGVTVFTFALALTTRVLNYPFAFAGNEPRLMPADELYHWKRIAYTAHNFPRVLELDPDRGVGGAFAPWPPLYDFVAGAIARVIGVTRVVWIPPFAGALAAAMAAALVSRRYGLLAGITSGIAIATSPFVVTQSQIVNIDHHFLEWPLVFAVMWWNAADVGGEDTRAGFVTGSVAMIAAMFTQTALLTACGLAFLVDQKRWRPFLATAIAIVIYRVTRDPGYPDSAWFLGWPHAALFLAAAVWHRSRALAIAIGLAAASALMQGATFFGGDRWLQTIVEFQPLWRSRRHQLLSQVVGLGAGTIFVWFLIRKERTLALFAIVFLALTIANRRFWSISIPLLAIAGAVYAASLTRKQWRIAAALAVAAIPAVQLTLWYIEYPPRPIERVHIVWLQTAEVMKTMPRGRVLGPWWLGHAIDVRGGQPVIVDGFGSMPDPVLFERVQDALLSRDESRLARFCKENGVRYVVLSDPISGTRTAEKILGIELPEKLRRSLWWWRAYEDRAQFQHFREVHRSDPEFRRAVMSVWEYDGGV